MNTMSDRDLAREPAIGAGRGVDTTAPRQPTRTIACSTTRSEVKAMTIRLCSSRAAQTFAALTLVAALGCAGCTTAPSAASPLATSTPLTSGRASDKLGPSATATSGPADTPTGTVSRPADPLVTASAAPVKRAGGALKPSISAKAGSFLPTQGVSYPDGIELTVTATTQAVESGRGPGMFPGRPLTEISLKLTNKGAAAIDLDQVVVTTTYGSPARLASPVYNDPRAVDFHGRVAAGASAVAVYVFSVPTPDLSRVTSVVDFDGLHAAATFTGAAR